MKKLKKIAAYFVIFLFIGIVLAIIIIGMLDKFDLDTATIMLLALFVSAALLLWAVVEITE